MPGKVQRGGAISGGRAANVRLRRLVTMPTRARQNGRRPYTQSGIHTLKRAIPVLGARALPPGNTALGRALREWRQNLLADLGGADAVSTQQIALVDLAVRTKLLADSVDAYVLAMPSPVNKTRRCGFRSIVITQIGPS